MTHLAFAIDGGGGNLTYQRNLAGALEGMDGIACDFFAIHIEQDDLWQRTPVLNRNAALLASARAAAALHGAHRGQPLDAAFIHSQSLALFALPLMRRVPTLISTDGTPANYDTFAEQLDHKVYGSTIEGAKKLWTKATLRAAERVLGFSTWVKDSLVNDYGCPSEKVEVIPSGVDVERWRPAPERRPGDGTVRILFTGGTFDRKGGPELLRWKERTPHRDVELHLVTGHRMSPTPGIVVHNGVVPNAPELVELAQRCDLFVLPTRGDCFPFAAIEAQAAGLPAVVSDVGGMREIVADGETGYLVPRGNFDALSERIDRLVGDAGLRRSMSAKARERAAGRFDARTNSKRVLRLMLELAGR